MGQSILGMIVGLGCTLARLPYGLMPFGIALCCIRGIPRYSIIGIYIGAVIGGIAVIGQPVYLAAVLITIPLSVILRFIFRHRRKMQSRVATFVSLLFYYIFIWIQYGMLTFDLIEGVAGIVLGTVFIGIGEKAVFQITNKNLQKDEMTSVIILVSLILTAVSEYSISGISPARIVAVIVILFLANLTRGNIVGLWGLILGLAFCLQDIGRIYLAVCYAIAAMVFSSINTNGKIIKISLFSAVFSVCAIYCSADNTTLAYICEVTFGWVIFGLIPEKLILRFSEKDELQPSREGRKDKKTNLPKVVFGRQSYEQYS